MKDPGFKLFGKTIPMQDEEKLKKFHQTSNTSIVTCTQENEKSIVKQVDSVTEVEDQNSNDSQGSQPCEDGNNCKETKSESEKEKSEDSKLDSNEADEKTPENEDKAPKKPDKLLPCPRCDSLDTKFCYYNNYNVNQPRHFCKNCQRYWTAGGTMRNVPVGAGRRKNKNSSSHYRHMMMADGIAATRADVHEAVHHHVMPGAISSSSGRVVKASQLQLLPLDVESGGTVLNFGPDAPLCESMANALNLTDHTLVARKIIKVKDEDRAGENKDDASCGSSMTASTSADKDGFKGYEGVTNGGEHGGMMGWPNGITPQQQQFYGACPWMYGWNVGWSGCPPTPQGCYSNGIVHPNVGENNTNGNGVTLNPANSSSTGPTPPAAMWATGIPWPFIPGTYWPGAGAWVGGSWNMPFSPLPSVASTASKAVSSSPSSSAGNSGNSGSPTLGKHCRENVQSEDKPDGCLWVPKTLRIDDPSEAAKSSIWTTLGIGSKSESISAGGIFKAFQPKSEERDSIKVSSQGLHANPAALSRSMAFQESAT